MGIKASPPSLKAAFTLTDENNSLGNPIAAAIKKAGPPALQFNIRHQQTLPLLVDGALGDLQIGRASCRDRV